MKSVNSYDRPLFGPSPLPLSHRMGEGKTTLRRWRSDKLINLSEQRWVNSGERHRLRGLEVGG